MPWKLIFLIICLILASVFTGLNLTNICNINFGFKVFVNVPVFMTILFSFLAGVLFALPFSFGRKNKQKTSKKEKSAHMAKPMTPSAQSEPKKLAGFFGKPKTNQEDQSSL